MMSDTPLSELTPNIPIQIGTIGQIQISATEPDLWHMFIPGDYVIILDKGDASHRMTVSKSTSPSQVIPKDAFKSCGYVVDSSDLDWDTLRGHLDRYLRINNLFSPRPIQPRTQKGRGIWALKSLHQLPSGVALAQHNAQEATYHGAVFPCMARPCPSRPRHGFVESRVVKDSDELDQVLTETLTHDPHGEVVCMPFIKAPYSAVVTNTMVAIGKGHDGATSGKAVYSIPCHSRLEATLGLDHLEITCKNGHHQSVNVDICRYISHSSNTRLFVETVGEILVQLRTGPLDCNGVGSQTAWAPLSRIVPSIVYTITGDEDFLAFETELTDIVNRYGKTNIIVYFPTGSLLSHYAVQTIAKGVAIVTTGKKPIVGHSYIFATQALTLRISAKYRTAARSGLAFGAKTDITSDSLAWAVSIIQGIGPADKNEYSVTLLVAASMILLRAGTGICLGEYRHFFRKGPGKHGIQPLGPIGPSLEYVFSRPEYTSTRDSMYQSAFTRNWCDSSVFWQMREFLVNVHIDFSQRDWDAAYGGKKWGNCTEATLAVHTALIPFYRMTSQYPRTSLGGSSHAYAHELVAQLILACNRLITVSHNSNKCLTKIITTGMLAKISNGATGLIIAKSPLTMKALTHKCKPNSPENNAIEKAVIS